MKSNIINFIRRAAPFLITIGLWRLAVPYINPAGVLAIIPIFFCTFIRPVPWFAPFAALMCFAIDYNFNTALYWTTIYCVCYAANGFQTTIDLTNDDYGGIGAFAIFFGAATLIIAIPHLAVFSNIFRTIWMMLFTTAMYAPITYVIKRIGHD